MEEIMKIRKKSFITVILSLLVIFFISIQAYPSSVRGVTDKTIRVGTIGDLTGPIATIWLPVADAIRDYFRNINDKGGINGRKVNNTIEDDRYSIPLALSAFKKLVFRDKVLLLMAASGVGHTQAIIPLAEKNKIPMLAQTNDRRYFNPVRRYIFTPLPFYEDQLEIIFEYIFKDKKSKKPTIALAYPDTASGYISRDTCRKLSKIYSVKRYIETIISTGAGDFSSQILQLKKLKPDFIIIHGYVGSTSAFLRDAYKFKFHSSFIAIQYACVEDTVKVAGISAKKLIGTNCFPSWDDESQGLRDIRRIVLKYHPEGKSKNRNYLQGWFAGILINNGLKNAGRQLSADTCVKGLEMIRNFDTKGLCGIVSFGPNDHKPIDYSRFYKADVKNGKLVPITGWRKPPKLKISSN